MLRRGPDGNGRDPVLEPIPSGSPRHPAFRFGELVVLATGERAARSVAWLVADEVRRFERSVGRRPEGGLVLAFDVGEEPPSSTALGWVHDSVDHAARLLGVDPPSVVEVRRHVREIERRAFLRGIPRAREVCGLLLRHRCGLGRAVDIAGAVGAGGGAIAEAGWGAVIPTPQAADALVARVVRTCLSARPEADLERVGGAVDHLRERLRASIDAELQGVLRVCLLLELAPCQRVAVAERMAALAELDRAATSTT